MTSYSIGTTGNKDYKREQTKGKLMFRLSASSEQTDRLGESKSSPNLFVSSQKLKGEKFTLLYSVLSCGFCFLSFYTIQ